MRFIDRESELKLLRDHLGRPGAGLFVLYGRRRIGKTALLQELIEGRPRTAYHVATRSTPAEELRRLSAALAGAFKVPLLEAQPLTSWPAVVAFLEALTEPSTVVLDEFPFLVEGEPALPGLLQAAWDSRLSRGPLKLVCCGSSVGMMEDVFVSRRSPLFGRRTGQLRLGPLAPDHLRLAFPRKAPEVVELAALFGGVPGYLTRLDPGKDLLGNLKEHVLAKGEPLYEEVPFLLGEELREPRVYQAVLATIAAGARRFGEVSSKVGLDRANLTRYLSVLADLGLVEREVPVTERRPDKSRKGLYRISDPFVGTWFALVHPSRDLLERGLVERALPEVERRLATLLPFAVEPVLRELAQGPVLESIVPFPPAAAGRYWSPTAEFEIVLLDENRRRAFVAEVKWGGAKVPAGLLGELRRRVEAEPAFRGVDSTCAVFSRNGFCGPRGVRRDPRLVDLSRLPW